MSFSRPVTVRFDEADARGILFYGRLHELAHRVYEEFVVSELVARWDDWFLSDRFIVPIRSAEAAYHHPMRPGTTYRAELVVTRIGGSSFDIATRFWDLSTAEPMLCAETRVSHVFADAESFEKIPVPSEFRGPLERHLARE